MRWPDLVWQSLQTVGAPQWDEAAKTVAREIQANLGLDAMQDPFIDECERLITLAGCRGDPAARPAAFPSQFDVRRLYRHDLAGADGAVLYCAAGAQGAARAIATRPGSMNALGGIPETIDPMVICAAKTLALSALRLLEDETSRTAAQARIRRSHWRRHRRLEHGSRRFATMRRRSTSAGPNMSPPPVAGTGGSPDRRSTRRRS